MCVLGVLERALRLLGTLFRERSMCIVYAGEGMATKSIMTGGVSVHSLIPNRILGNKTISWACLPQKGTSKSSWWPDLKVLRDVNTFEERFYRVNGRWRKGDLFGWRI